MGTDNKSLEEENSEKIERFLKSKGAELVAFANLEGIKNVPPLYRRPDSICRSNEECGFEIKRNNP